MPDSQGLVVGAVLFWLATVLLIAVGWLRARRGGGRLGDLCVGWALAIGLFGGYVVGDPVSLRILVGIMMGGGAIGFCYLAWRTFWQPFLAPRGLRWW